MVWTITVEAEQAAQIEAAAARQGLTPEEYLVAVALGSVSVRNGHTQPQNGQAETNHSSTDRATGSVTEDEASAPVPPWAESLAQAANRNDESGFIVALREIDREYLTPADWILLTRLAVTAGAHTQARGLAEEGARYYPADERLRQRARILAPPRVTRTFPVDPAAAAARRADREWMRRHWNEHRREWIALHAGQLLGTAPTLRELRETLRHATAEATSNPFVTKIF